MHINLPLHLIYQTNAGDLSPKGGWLEATTNGFSSPRESSENWEFLSFANAPEKSESQWLEFTGSWLEIHYGFITIDPGECFMCLWVSCGAVHGDIEMHIRFFAKWARSGQKLWLKLWMNWMQSRDHILFEKSTNSYELNVDNSQLYPYSRNL